MKNPLIILFLLIATCAGAQVVPQGFLRPHNTFTCGTSITKAHVAGVVAPVDKTVTYSTVTNIPGEVSKCWIASNLGASQQATAINDATEASAGWYWQFNRKQGYKHDGSTRTPSGAWTNPISENSEWLPANDPCTVELGAGWRIPTYTEWNTVFTSGAWEVADGPWNSGLKLHAAGDLHYTNGSLQNRGTHGEYWSSTKTVGFDNAFMLYVATNASQLAEAVKSWGYTLRCLRNLLPTVTTTAATSITSTTASSGGNVTDDGGSVITARGVCWSATTGPTVALTTKTTETGATGVFASALTNLAAFTTYYVRAYATSAAGTAYGNEVSFKTLLAIGDAYQGGKVVYFFQPGNPGYIGGETHGLIVSAIDNAANIPWGIGSNAAVGAFGLSIGEGPAATRKIVDALGAGYYAAYVCDTLTLNGYTDWYLPSRDEMRCLYNNRYIIGGVDGGIFWISLEENFYAYNTYFTSPLNEYSMPKSTLRRVRAFRTF
ncbi:MAG: hypothetical protein NT004_10355 [Bacteroidetes bacterium]|nr:hypothetical protein [Bacteroidota bacterium]